MCPIDRALLVVALMAAPLLGMSMRADAQSPNPDLAIVTGSVYAVAVQGHTLYLGGNFTSIGRASGGFAVVDSAQAYDRHAPAVLGVVSAIVSDGAGGWFLGGNFTYVGGLPRSNLAHVLANGSVSSWNPGTNGGVTSLALSGSLLYVGGAFSIAGGQSRSNLVALDASSGAVAAWNPAPNNQVNTIQARNGLVYVGGFFTQIAGQTRNRAAAVDAGTGAATPWNPNLDGTVSAMAFRDTLVYLGGTFSTVQGQSRMRLTSVGVVGGVPTAWAPNPTVNDNIHFSSSVAALAIVGSTVYVSGGFDVISGVARAGAASLDAVSAAVGPWTPGRVGVIVPAGDRIYVTGGLNGFEAVDPVYGTVLPWYPTASSYGAAIAYDGDQVALGGTFQIINYQTRRHLAAIDLDTGQPTPWAPIANEAVYALAVGDSVVYAGGHFTQIDNQDRHNLAAFDLSTGAMTSWNPGVGALGSYVFALATLGNTVYVGGSFDSVGAVARHHLAAVGTHGAVASWNPSANAPVYALGVTPSAVYAGGQFTQIGSTTRNHLTAFDPASGTLTSWAPSVTGSDIFTIVPHGNTIYVGGAFGMINTASRSNVAALTAAGAVAAWNPGANQTVRAITADHGVVYLTGSFGSVGGGNSVAIAAVDSASGMAQAWNPKQNGDGYALALTAQSVVAGGTFPDVGGWPLRGVAEYYRLGVTAVPPQNPVTADLGMRVSPNPMASDLAIDFSLPVAEHSRVVVYDALGRVIGRLFDARAEAGFHRVHWNGMQDGRRVPAGLYFARVEAGETNVTRRIVRLQ